MHSIFISYAHVDDGTGWVKGFHDVLGSWLQQLGVQAAIWRDPKLGGSDEFGAAIEEQLREASLLISVVSPSGMGSEWCKRERALFQEAAEKNGGFRVGNKCRALKVVKAPVRDGSHRELYGALGYEYFVEDVQSGKKNYFLPSDEKFQKLTALLADDIQETLVALPAPVRITEKLTGRILSNIPPRGPKKPFVGRNELLRQMQVELHRARIVVLHGQPGVGKSELAREFGRLNLGRYPGGTYFINCAKGAFAAEFEGLGRQYLGRLFPNEMKLEDRAIQVLLALCAVDALLIYDNAETLECLEGWLPRAGMRCHALVTTIPEPRAAQWLCLIVPPLRDAEVVMLVNGLSEGRIGGDKVQSIAQNSGGLPVQVVPAALAAAYEVRRGRSDEVQVKLSSETKSSFAFALECLSLDAKLLLEAAAIFDPQRIPRDELTLPLCNALEWEERRVLEAMDQCVDFHLLEDSGDVRMHQLLSRFLRENTGNVEEVVRDAQWRRFGELASLAARHPAQGSVVSRFLTYPMRLENWGERSERANASTAMLIGQALYQIGRFEEACAWFTRSVTLYEKGNSAGELDHESLGLSLGYVGGCFSDLKRYSEALPWFERAVEETRKGNAFGHVDHARLGITLQNVGICYWRQKKFSEAMPWFESASREDAIGDLQQRIDSESLGRSLGFLGLCHYGLGQFAEALPLLHRSVIEKKKGDLEGRVDHASLGIGLQNLALCYLKEEKYTEALQWLEQAVEEKLRGDIHGRVDHSSLGVSMFLVGSCYSNLKKHTEAVSWFDRALIELSQGDIHGRVDDKNIANSLEGGAEVLEQLGELERASEWRERVEILLKAAGAVA